MHFLGSVLESFIFDDKFLLTVEMVSVSGASSGPTQADPKGPNKPFQNLHALVEWKKSLNQECTGYPDRTCLGY